MLASLLPINARPRPVSFSCTLGILVLLLAARTSPGQASASAVNLGSSAVGTPVTQSVAVQLSGDFSAATPTASVVTQGMANLDFVLNGAAACGAGSYNAGTNITTCMVPVKFTPKAPGIRLGDIQFNTNNGTSVNTLLFGTGTGGLLTAVPGTQTAITGTSGFTAAGPMAVDAAGNLYIADRNSGVIYKEVISGTTATQTQLFNVGASVASLALDGAGNIFLASPSAKEIYELQLAASGTYTQQGLYACSYGCNAVSLDPSGNLYFSDVYAIYVLPYNGNGSYSLSSDYIAGLTTSTGVATPGDGYLYVSYSTGAFNFVDRFQFTGVSSTGGTTPSHNVSSPGALVLDASANVYVTSSAAGIQRFNYNNGNTATLGNVVAAGVAIAGNGTVYLNDGASTIYAVNQAAAPSTISSSQNYTSPEKSVTLLNIGNSTATLGASTTATPFTIASDSTCTSGLALASTATCSLKYTFSPTSGSSPQTGTISVASDSGTATLNVTGNVSGVPAALSFTTAPATPVTAGGNAGTAQVQVQDANGNLVTAPATVTITSNYPGYPSVSGTSSAGTATIPLPSTMTVGGSYTFTASTSGATSATATVVVTGAQAASLTVTAANASPYPGIADSITVTGYDQYGNISQTGDTIALTSSDAAATLPANFTLSSSTGAGSANVAFGTPGSQTVTATDKTTGVTGTSATIAVKNLPVFTVTALNNGSPTNASNCPDQANGGAPSSNCGIYDATAASNAVGFTGITGLQPTINFSPSLYSSTQSQTCPVSSITPPGGGTAVTTSAPCLYPLVLTITANVNIVGPGPDKFALRGFSPSGAAIFTLNASNVHFTLSGLTITGSNGYSAIYNIKTGNSITLQNDVFYNNATGNGYSSGSPTTQGGAAVYDAGTGNTLTIANSTFDTNSVVNNNTTAGYGGALYLSGVTYTITGSTFTNNTASYTGSTTTYFGAGGAIYATGSPASTVSKSSFIGNSALSSSYYAYGGAVYSTAGSGNDTWTDTVFIGNKAQGGSSYGYGGALSYATKTLTLIDSLVQGNIATTNASSTFGSGGGIYSSAAKYLYNTTITGNYAKYAYGGVGPNLLYTYNSIVYGNGAGSSYADMSTSTTTLGSLVNTSASTTVLNPGLSAPSNIGSFAGPINGAGAYAAAQYTMVPLPGSPALRIGSTANTGCTGTVNNASQTSCLAGQTVDGRGLPRTQTNGVDAGQTESNYSLAFTAEPASTTVNTTVPGSTNGTATNTPFVQVYESGTPFSTGGTLTLAAASGTPTATSVTIGASPQPLSVQFAKPQSNDSLTASIRNGAATPVTVVSTISSTFNITDGAASLAFGTAPPAQLMTGSAPGTVTVKMTTASGAVYTSGADTITLTVTASGYTTQTYTAAAVNGVATFSSLPALTTNGTYTYTASDTSSSPYTTDTVATTEMVVSDPVDHFTLTGLPATAVPGAAYPVTVTAIDASGATDTSFTGTVTLSSTDAAATFAPLGYTFAAGDAGVHAFTVTFNTRGMQTLIATDNTGQSGSSSVQVFVNYVWLVNQDGTLDKLNTAGVNTLGGAVGSSGMTSAAGGVAFDSAGNVWSVTNSNNSLDFRTTAGAGANTFTGGGLNSPDGVAIDGAGSVWITNSGNNSLSLFTNSGVAVSNSNGVAPASVKAPSALAIDNTGGIWVTNKSANSVTHLFGAAQPVVTPLAGAVSSTQLGTKP